MCGQPPRSSNTSPVPPPHTARAGLVSHVEQIAAASSSRRPCRTHTRCQRGRYRTIEAGLPLDREPYECLVKAVLAWTGPEALAERDYEQIALQLTGHARAVASDVRRRAARLPKDSGPRALADVVPREAEGRLSVTIEGTVRCVQNRARLVRALYERLDRLEAAHPRAV